MLLVLIVNRQMASSHAGDGRVASPRAANRMATLLALTFLVSIGASVARAQCTAVAGGNAINWTAASGNWSTAANWSLDCTPNNGGGITYAVSVSSGYVTLDIDATIDSLELRSGGNLIAPSAEGVVAPFGLTVNGATMIAKDGSLLLVGTNADQSGALGYNFNGNVTNSGIVETWFAQVVMGGAFTNSGGLALAEVGDGPGSEVTVVGNFDNSGSTLLQSDAGAAQLTVLGDSSNEGSIDIQGGLDGDGFSTGGTLTNKRNISLWELDGFIRANVINNSGSIDLYLGTLSDAGDFNNSSGGSLSVPWNVGVPVVVSVGGNFNNDAGASVTLAGYGDTLSAASFTNRGSVLLGPTETMTIGATGTYAQTAGSTTVDGTLTAGSGVNIQGGSLLGAGTINGNVNNSGGSVEPASAAGIPAILTVSGNYEQGPAGTLTIDLGGILAGQFSVLNVSGLAVLDGTVDFTAVNGFTPESGDDFTFLLFGSSSGNFTNVEFTNWTCPEGDTCMNVFGPNSLTLEIKPSGTPEPSAWLMLGTALLSMVSYGIMHRRRAERA
jgi:hypothetical protein